MNVRMATVEDIAWLIKARFDYFSSENWKLTDELRASIARQLQEYFPKHLNEDFFAALVEDDNRSIVSIAFLVISEKPANMSFPTGKIGTILNVHTNPDYRKKGYATNTLNLLVLEARRQNLSYIELSASESGKTLYEKLGFRELEPSSHFTEMRMPIAYELNSN